MKALYQLLLLTASILLFQFSYSQTAPPLLINYQAIAHDNSGNTLNNQTVDLIINIHDDTQVVWSEEHNGITTNDYGLISLMIGNGTNQSGPLSGVSWSGDTHYLEIFIDDGFGSVSMGKNQLVSVPYAFHALTVENDLVDDADADSTNEIQTISINGTDISLSNGGGTISIPSIDSASIANLGFVAGPHTIDTDTQLDSSGVAALGFVAGPHTIDTDTHIDSAGIASLGFITSGQNETDPVFSSSLASGITTSDTINWNNHTDNQNLTGATLTGTNLQIDIENGTSATVDLANLQDGVDDADADSTNELQTISINGSDITLSDGGGTITIPVSPAADGSETIINAGTDINISGTGTIADPYVITNSFTEVDGSTTNELSDLDLNAGILTLSNPATGGNSVTLPTADGSETIINAGTDVTISGTGTSADPYIITNSFTEVDGSTTNEVISSSSLDAGGILTIIEGGTTSSIDLSTLNNTGTDDQNISGSSFDINNDLTIGIENGSSETVNLSDLNESVTAGTGISVSESNGIFSVENTGDSDATDDITNTTAAGGDLSGTYPDPTVVNIQGTAVSTTAPNDNQILVYNAGTTSWEPSDRNPDADWTINGTDMYSTVSGNIGIGTSTPSVPLQIDYTGQVGLQVNGNNSSWNAIYMNGVTSTGGIGYGYLRNNIFKGGTYLTSTDDWHVRLWDGSSTVSRLYVKRSNGNIGISNTDPDTKLHISNGTIKIDDGSNPYSLPSSDGNANQIMITDGSGVISWQTPGDDGDWTLGDNAGVPVVYNTTELVGINTNTPNSLLTIKEANAGTQIGILNSSDQLRHDFKINGGGDAVYQMYDNNGNMQIQLFTNGPTVFNGGNVGIGTSTPDELFHVDSDVNSDVALFESSEDYSVISVNSNTGSNSGGGFYFSQYKDSEVAYFGGQYLASQGDTIALMGVGYPSGGIITNPELNLSTSATSQRVNLQVFGSSNNAREFSMRYNNNSNSSQSFLISDTIYFRGGPNFSDATEFFVSGKTTSDNIIAYNGFRYENSPNTGYILQSSDNLGNATWVDPSSIAAANDGDWTINSTDIYSDLGGHVSIGTNRNDIAGYQLISAGTAKKEFIISANNGSGTVAPAILALEGSSSVVGDEIGVVDFINSSQFTEYNFARIAATKENTNNTYGALRFYTRKGAALTERMTIDEDGKIGFNSNNPTSLFEIRESFGGDQVVAVNGRTVRLGDVDGGGTGGEMYIDGDGNNEVVISNWGASTLKISATDGDILFSGTEGSITYPANSSATAKPMINMFASGTTNSDRMVIAHSPGFTNYGLEYEDATDQFNFLGNGTSALSINLPNRYVGVNNSSPSTNLDVVGGFQYEDGNQGTDKVLSSDASGNASWSYSKSPTKYQHTSSFYVNDGDNKVYHTSNIINCTPNESGVLNIIVQGTINRNASISHQIGLGIKITNTASVPAPGTNFDHFLYIGDAFGINGAGYGEMPFTLVYQYSVTANTTYYFWIGGQDFNSGQDITVRKINTLVSLGTTNGL